MRFVIGSSLLFAALSCQAQLQPHTLPIAAGKSITLSLPAPLDISVAASGIKRPRFFAQAPDGRIFVTSMYNLADNTRGAVYILDGWDAQSHRFARTIPYLQHLRNPNNLAFYTDSAKQIWLYVPLTDRLVRYRYNAGDMAPSGPPQTLLRFPDYGLNYKYGGWHLTRTVAVATMHGVTRIFVTSGSSCNYCREVEAERAALIAMDPDGRHPKIVAHGLRNAVGLRFVPEVDGGALFATNMGDDHLGDKLPEDTFFELDANARAGAVAAAAAGRSAAPNYGWPACYFAHGVATLDSTPLPANPGPNDAKVDAPRPANAQDYIDEPHAAADSRSQGGQKDSVYGAQHGVAQAGTNLAAQQHHDAALPMLGPVPDPLTTCKDVPAAYMTFAAHSSPLGLAYFGEESRALKSSFLVALHGAGHPRIGVGYRLVRFNAGDRTPRDFLTGFLTRDAAGEPLVHGRPCGMLRLGPDSFLLTDDYLGLVYYIGPHA